ncbi:MAG: hypothetical protein ACXV1K_01140 [Kineosporiaceae bacterium]
MVARDGDDTAIILDTSGPTVRPKPKDAELAHRPTGKILKCEIVAPTES